MRPRAVEPGEVAGPKEIREADFGHAPKAAPFLHLEGEEELPFDELGGLLGQLDVGLEYTAVRSAELVFAVEAPEQERHPADAGLFQHKAHSRMAVADAREDDGAHQFAHRTHREVGDPHQRLVARCRSGDADPHLADPPLGWACKLTGNPVAAAAAQTGSHIWCKTGSGAFTQSKMTPVGRPKSATRRSSAAASSGVWQGSGSSMITGRPT